MGTARGSARARWRARAALVLAVGAAAGVLVVAAGSPGGTLDVPVAPAVPDVGPARPPRLAIEPPSWDFGDLAVRGRPVRRIFTVYNDGEGDAERLDLQVEEGDYFAVTGSTCPERLPAGRSCSVEVSFRDPADGRPAQRPAEQEGRLRAEARGAGGAARAEGSAAGPAQAGLSGRAVPLGYYVVTRSGRVSAFGSAGGPDRRPDSGRPVVAAAASPSGQGYWLAGPDGSVSALGDARPRGSAAGLALAAPVVAMVPTPSGEGYWLAGADGGVFAFGDAPFAGSAAAGPRAPGSAVSAIAATRSGRGYWVATADGSVLAFGDATLQGSASARPAGAPPVVAMTPSPGGRGYWLATADGGVLSFGDAPALAPAGEQQAGRPVVAMAPSSAGAGYWLAGLGGVVGAFGDAVGLGGIATGAEDPVVALAAVPVPVRERR